MNISYNLLNDLIDTDLSADDSAAALTRVGLAVEGVHQHGNDYVLDIDLTSNRPDCLSHLGVARELSVISSTPVKLPPVTEDVPVPAALAGEVVTVEDPDLCHRFTARIVRGVKVGPSPQWLVDRLEALGERSINNVADITNYVMLELGQPMHAFDLDKLAGRRIIVRRAKKGEKIVTLKEEEKALDSDVLAICDAEKPVAIGGVIGGLDSSITDETVNVLLEVAYFKRDSIRATSRRLGLATEASYRFERGVDIQNLRRASDRASSLICELAGGEIGEFYDVFPQPQSQNLVESADISSQVARLTGLAVPPEECDRILAALGIERTENSPSYISPSWRHDISIEEDLVEEIARHVGYEVIAAALPPSFGAGEYQPGEFRKRRLRDSLSALGFDEAITYSFIDAANDDIFEPVSGLIDDAAEEKLVELKDAVIEGAVRMRPTLLPGLLDAVRLNLNRQRRDLKLFEIGRVFARAANEDGLPNERQVLALVLTGTTQQAGPGLDLTAMDLFDAKGAVEIALASTGARDTAFSAAEPRHLRKGQAAQIALEGRNIGTVGRLNDPIAAEYKFKQPVFVAELDLDAVLTAVERPAVYVPLGRFPSVTRDISLVGDRSVAWAEIRAAVEEQNVEICRSVDFVDIYEGPGLAADERSLTLRLTYRSDERTLIEDEVELVHARILGHLEQKLGLKPRA